MSELIKVKIKILKKKGKKTMKTIKTSKILKKTQKTQKTTMKKIALTIALMKKDKKKLTK